MILDDIHDKLAELDSNVFYGLVDEDDNTEAWNYTIFGRANTSMTANKTGYSDVFRVAVVRENYIPDGTEDAVISKVEELAGMRCSSDVVYTYTRKPNTNTVVELMVIEFTRARKRV